MYAILVSAAATLFNQVLKAAIIKFCVFAALFALTTAFIPLLTPLLPTTAGITSALGSLSDDYFFYSEVFMLWQGVQIVLAAYATRFIIRRLPVIG